jgi:hypothetical protein
MGWTFRRFELPPRRVGFSLHIGNRLAFMVDCGPDKSIPVSASRLFCKTVLQSNVADPDSLKTDQRTGKGSVTFWCGSVSSYGSIYNSGSSPFSSDFKGSG